MAAIQRNVEDKKPPKIKTSSDKSDKKYATLSTRSVALMAESAGFPAISAEIATVLAQDVCYRIRETAQASTQFMKHSKRRRLTVDDFNKALKWSDVQPIHGYGSHKSLTFMKGEADVYFPEDKEVNLPSVALDLEVPATAGRHTVKASWLSLEGAPKGSSSVTVSHNLSDLSEELQRYYHEVTKVILDKEADGMEMILEDLVSNPKISSLLPYLVNFIESGVKTVSHDLFQLNRLLQAVDALLRNEYFYLGPYVSRLTSSVTYCILEPLAASINPLNDHWSLRVYASRLLHPLVKCCRPLPPGLYSNLLQTLKDVLSDSARPLCSHYGGVISLAALGPQAIEEVLVPVLPTYWQYLQPILDDNSLSSTHIRENGQKVYGAILNAAEIILKNRYRDFLVVKHPASGEASSSASSTEAAGTLTSSNPMQEERQHACSANELYQIFYEYLGDSLSLRLWSEGPFNSVQPNLSTEGDRVNLLDLVNKKVVFNGTRFMRKQEQTEEDENAAKMRSLSRPPRLGTSGREGLRRRQGKVTKRQQSHTPSLKEAFPLAEDVRTYGRLNLSRFLNLPGYIEPLQVREWPPIPQEQRSTEESAMWRVSRKMRPVGKHKMARKWTEATPFHLGMLL